MLLSRKPKYKIGTLLKINESNPGQEQIIVADYFPMAEEYRIKDGATVKSEYWMYNLMYLGKGGKMIAQTALWLEEMIGGKKIEIASTPD